MKPSRMWHEARRQERRIRGMLVDYRRRAERRRDFYEKIKADPTQFLQIHGRQCKIHLDPSVAAAADSPAAMMPWQGQSDNLIDRFDVRAHLDVIPPIGKQQETENSLEERQVNYERYRIVAQNSFLAISEEKFLRQLRLEEQFGYTEIKSKKDKPTGVAIGFNYEDGTGTSQALPEFPEQCESEDNSDSELDVDLSINVSKIDSVQAHELNRHGCNYGMSSNDFYSFLTNDLEEAENYKLAKEEENEKALFAGRKSRRERRAQREKRIINRTISPPSYAAKASPTYPSIFMNKSPSRSRSPSPVNAGKITYITSFGGEEEALTTSKPTYADKVKYGKSKRSSSRDKNASSRSRSHEKNNYKKRRTRSRSRSKRRSRSRDRYRRSRSRSPSPHKDIATLRSNSTSSSSSCSSRSSQSASHQVQSGSGTGGHLQDKVSPPKVVTRYYGRRKSDQSTSSSESNGEDGANSKRSEEKQSEKGASYGNSGSAIKSKHFQGSSSANLSIQEKLKRKRQALLAKQYKADKIAEQMKTEREKQEQLSRKEELREMAIKLRKRQREKRHAYDSDESSSSASESGSPTSQRSARNYRSKSKSSTSSEEHNSEGKSRPNRKRSSPEKKRESRERSRERNMESTERSRDVRERKQNSRDRNWGSADKNRDSRELNRGSKETTSIGCRERSRGSRERSRGSGERSRGSRERSRGSRERSQECDNRSTARYQYRSRNTERTSERERYDRERQNREPFQREQKCDMEERSRDYTRRQSPARRYSPKRYHGPTSRDYGYRDMDRGGTNEGDFRERREYGSCQSRGGNYNKQRGPRALVDY